MAILKEDLPDDFEFHEHDGVGKGLGIPFVVITAAIRDSNSRVWWKTRHNPPALKFKLDVVGGSIHLTRLDTAQIWDFGLADPEVFEKVRTRFSMELVK